MALSDRCQLDEIVSQGEQAQLCAYFFQAAQHKSAKVSIVFDMSEHAFHIPATAGPQLDPIIRSQALAGGSLQTPVVPTDTDLAVAVAPGALFFDRTGAAIETGIAADAHLIACFGSFDFGALIRQKPPFWAGEAVALRVVGEVLSPEGVIPLLGFAFLVKGAIFEVSVAFFLFGVGQVFLRPIGAITHPVLRQASQELFDLFQMRDQTRPIVGLLVDAEPDDELVFGAQLHIVGWLGPGLALASVFFHAHERGRRVRFRVAVALSQLLFLVFILGQPRQIILFQLPNGFF